jgi:hypothetical protein
MRVRLQSTLDLARAARGDRFTGWVDHPVTDGSGRIVIPARSRVGGHTVAVHRFSQTLLDLVIDRVDTGAGPMPIEATAAVTDEQIRDGDALRFAVQPSHQGAASGSPKRALACPPVIEVPSGASFVARLDSPIDAERVDGEGAVALVMLSPLRSARGELLVSVGSKVTARVRRAPGANGSALALSFQSIETLLGTAPLQARAEQGLDGYAAIEPSAHAVGTGGASGSEVMLVTPKATRTEPRGDEARPLQIPSGIELTAVLVQPLRIATPKR